ncbi:hypothetical protein IJH74_00515, partial [Candidatus Saccharibacteria bacterium]|nr:hypothetical protein [Candidatus Saccharibacteria bacterium]
MNRLLRYIYIYMAVFFAAIASLLPLSNVHATQSINYTTEEGFEEYRWGEHIDELLKGNYIEGEVIVGIDNSKKSLTFTRLFGGQELADTGDEIATVSEDSLELSSHESSDKDISIEVIRRDDMTTREIMEALRGDSA